MATFEFTPLRFVLALAVIAAPVGCGGTEPAGSSTPANVPTTTTAASTPTTTSTKPAEASGPKAPSARDRLQGKWQIARYQADKAIPDEASPVMSTLFGALRVEFNGTNATAKIEGSATQETARFDIGRESGDDFTLYAPGFMFDGAQCRFTADGQVEIKDGGERWPGVTSLKRAP